MNGLTPLCPYCGQFSAKVGGDAIYPHRPDLHHKVFYLCSPCNAYVGTHPGTDQPLGRLADAELRHWKSRTHVAFDPIWQRRFERKRAIDPSYKKGMARGGRYRRLAELMGIPRKECHIGMFDVAACQRAIEICQSGALED
ncbi:zinc-finger-containing protein [Halomonas elongata]|uniref:zinc-finger-containing protein n=1 Tax=Halomonas elongata TaxID=2746 RepID=UPI003347C400